MAPNHRALADAIRARQATPGPRPARTDRRQTPTRTAAGSPDPVVARFVAGGMAALSLLVTARALGEHQRFGGERDRLYAAPLAAAVKLDRAVVFLPPLDGPWLLQPFSLARNASFDSRVVWAIDRGPVQNLEVARHLGRTPYRVVPGPGRRSPTRLQQLAEVDGRLVAMGLAQ